MNNYYSKRGSGIEQLNWIRTHPSTGSKVIKNYIFNNAGEIENSLLMALAPEEVKIDRVSVNKT